VGEGGDRLGAAHAVDLVGAAQRRGGQDQRMRRRGDHHLVDARRRAVTTPITTEDGYGVLAAGRVDRRAAHRHLAQADALALLERHLGLRVESRPGDGADVGDRHLQAGAHRGRQRLARGGELGVVDAQRLSRGAEAPLVVEHRRIAAGAHAGDDSSHRVGYRGRLGHQRAHMRDGLRRARGVAAQSLSGTARSRTSSIACALSLWATGWRSGGRWRRESPRDDQPFSRSVCRWRSGRRFPSTRPVSGAARPTP
jgi:hypothetical protein